MKLIKMVYFIQNLILLSMNLYVKFLVLWALVIIKIYQLYLTFSNAFRKQYMKEFNLSKNHLIFV